MLKKSNVDVLTDLSEVLEATTPDSKAIPIMSADGLMSASALLQEREKDQVDFMSAAMLSLGERFARELTKGELSEGCLTGESGYVLLMAAGDTAVFTVPGRKNAKLAFIPGLESNSRVWSERM